MKDIISTTGDTISFNFSASRKLFITPDVAISVSEHEFNVLKSRLGNQIEEIQPAVSKGKYDKMKGAADSFSKPERKFEESSDIDDEKKEEI